MGASPRRWVRRGCLSAAGAFALLAISYPVFAQEVPAGAPEVFRGAANAGAASVNVNREALLPVEGVFHFITPDGDSVYETDLQTARSSLFYPGEGVLQGPSLMCGTFGGRFPPQFAPLLEACSTYDYPLTVKANASQSDAESDGTTKLGKPTDPISAEAAGAVAHAAPDGSSTRSEISDLRVLGTPGVSFTSLLPVDELKVDPTMLRIGNATSTTDQRIDAGKLVTTAQSKLSGVALVGGLVKIGSIISTSTTTDDGNGVRTAVAETEVGGVTVAGMPAQITEDGLVIGSPSGSGPVKQQVQQAANQLLQTLGVRISLLDNVESEDDGTGLARAQAPGVLVEVTTHADGAPPVPGPLGPIDLNGEYVGTIQLGMSGAAAGATNFDDEVIPPPDISFDAPVDAGFVPTDAGVLDAGSAAPEATSPAESPGGSEPQQLLRSVVDRFGGRMGMLYLAFAFTVLGLCLVPVLTLPARLPGARS